EEKNVTFNAISDPFKPRLSTNKDGNYCFNLSNGPRYTVRPKKFSDEALRGAKLFWKHFESIWCSRNKVTYEYLRKWISHAITGRKMKSTLYLQSDGGEGKSVALEFLQENVIGS